MPEHTPEPTPIEAQYIYKCRHCAARYVEFNMALDSASAHDTQLRIRMDGPSGRTALHIHLNPFDQKPIGAGVSDLIGWEMA